MDHGPRAYAAKANSCGDSGTTTCPLPLPLQPAHFRFPGKKKKNPALGEVINRLPLHVTLGTIVCRSAERSYPPLVTDGTPPRVIHVDLFILFTMEQYQIGSSMRSFAEMENQTYCCLVKEQTTAKLASRTRWRLR